MTEVQRKYLEWLGYNEYEIEEKEEELRNTAEPLCFEGNQFYAFESGYNIAKEEDKALIDKMKNWCNCRYYQECLIELAEQGKGMKPSECCVNCKKWELKED